MPDDARRYAQLGWTYEKFNPLRKEEIAWHRQMARDCGGPILELACGSGRLCTALAMAGFAVDALDNSSGMLARAQMRIGSLTADVRARINLVEADICDFTFESTYKLVIIADNSLAELSAPDRARCLDRVRKHLKPGGKLVFTVRVYEDDALNDGRVETQWTEPVTHPITGISVRRKTELNLSDDGAQLKGTMTYEITQSDDTVDLEVCPIELARCTRNDYHSLLSENGWTIESDDSPVGAGQTSDSSVVRFVCGIN